MDEETLQRDRSDGKRKLDLFFSVRVARSTLEFDSSRSEAWPANFNWW